MTPRFLSILQLALLVFLGLTLIPAGAHLFEMPGKMALAPADYMIVQRIYMGWAWFGIAIFGALILLGIHAAIVRRDRTALWFPLAAFAAIAVTQIIFWSFTFPMNTLTQNWTVNPPDIEVARRQWEYSHAVNALITFAAFVLTALAILKSHHAPQPLR